MLNYQRVFLWKALGPPFVLRLPFVYDPKSRRIWNNFKCNTRSARPRVITIAWPTLRPGTWGGTVGLRKTARGLVRHEGFSTGGGPGRPVTWGWPARWPAGDGQQREYWCWSLLKWPILWSTAHNRYCILYYIILYIFGRHVQFSSFFGQVSGVELRSLKNWSPQVPQNIGFNFFGKRCRGCCDGPRRAHLHGINRPWWPWFWGWASAQLFTKIFEVGGKVG